MLLLMKTKYIKNLIFIALALAICLFLYFVLRGLSSKNSAKTDTSPSIIASSTVVKNTPADQASSASSSQAILTLPINNALERVTKKPFGIQISPGHSPVSPEKFSGYHTGTDFETFAEEKNIDIPIFAVCDGKLIYKNYVSGYGGVIIQSCRLADQDVTVLYGHLKLTSIKLKIGNILKAGEQIAVLGKGYSTETSGERKHLHLGIHKGKNIVLSGYVQKQPALTDWIDPLKYLK
jgi:murein DD-endopeptidase MepM/ murein hydrolase activator NlpD